MINKNPIEEFDTEEPGMYIQQVGTFSSPTRIHVFPIYFFFCALCAHYGIFYGLRLALNELKAQKTP